MDEEAAPKPKPEKSLRGGRKFRKREFFDLVYSSPWPWAVVLWVGFTALLTPGLSLSVGQYQLGDISPATVRAPFDFSYEDELTTESRRLEAAEAVLEVYNFNDLAAADAGNRIAEAFAYGREALQSRLTEDEDPERGPPTGEPRPPLGPQDLLAGLQERMEVTPSEAEIEFLIEQEFSGELEQVLTRAVTNVLSRDIVANKERLLASGQPIRRRETLRGGEQLRREYSSILSTAEAEELLVVQLASMTDLRQPERVLLASIGEKFIEPTLGFDIAETERLRRVAREDVDPVYYQVQRGKTIVRAGDEIGERALRQLEILSSQQQRRWGLAGTAGALFLSALLLLILWYLLRPVRPTREWRMKTFAMVGVVMLSHLALARAGFFVGRMFSEQILVAPFNNSSSYFYGVPFAGVAVIVLLLEHTPTALLASTLFSIALGIMTGSLELAAFSLLSCLAAILGLFEYKRRTALFKLGLLVGSVNFVAVLAIDLLGGRYFPPSTFSFDLLCAFLGGASVSIVVSFLLPAFESLFQRTTDIRLLELANNNVPMLRRLALEAPGTYHHSMVVGSLAEAAAEAIGANAVFCRTAAMYHDIGKLAKVNYFVENQVGPNKHDGLSPRMSALIIASHVKEGIEMGKEIDLPQEIIDVIPQHHGTKLITYFYQKAKQFQDPALGEVTEEEFRYPGPKPQTKEAGIIMIADAAEAASRTVDEPSPARLKGMIRQIIDYIFLDGQLNECDLTLRDLEKIADSFLRVLVGIHHHRISYPGFDFEKEVEPVVVQDGR